MKLSNKKILITGAGSGIGKALVKELSGHGVKEVAVMGRTGKKLDTLEKEFPSIDFLKILGDVSYPDEVKKASEKVNNEWNNLDILVNNAGVVSAGLLSEISDEDIIDQVNINLTGLILMTRHFLPLIQKSQEGGIINVSSGLGYVAMPYYSVYAATKSAVKHFSEAMRRELSGYSIHVMTVFPRSTDTPMMESANVDSMDCPDEVAKALIEGFINKDHDVILGGDEQKDLIRLNFEKPLQVDQKVESQFESIGDRAKNHRSM